MTEICCALLKTGKQLEQAIKHFYFIVIYTLSPIPSPPPLHPLRPLIYLSSFTGASLDKKRADSAWLLHM